MAPTNNSADSSGRIEGLIAVTGGSGFLGRYVIRQLLDAGLSVRALQNTTPVGMSHENLEIFEGSLNVPDTLSPFIDNCEAVIHLGGLVAARNRKDFFATNSSGTQSLIQMARKARVTRFLLISSLAARESQLSAYAASKRAAEKRVVEQTDVAWDILRPPAIYGPGDTQILFLLKLLKMKVGLLPAGHEARISLIHAADMASATVSWAQSGKATRVIYELDDGHENGYSWPEVLCTAGTMLGVTPRLVAPPGIALKFYAALGSLMDKLRGNAPFITPDKVNEISHRNWVCDNDGAFGEQFAWRPSYSLEDGLAQMICWLEQEGWL